MPKKTDTREESPVSTAEDPADLASELQICSKGPQKTDDSGATLRPKATKGQTGNGGASAGQTIRLAMTMFFAQKKKNEKYVLVIASNASVITQRVTLERFMADLTSSCFDGAIKKRWKDLLETGVYDDNDEIVVTTVTPRQQDYYFGVNRHHWEEFISAFRHFAEKSGIPFEGDYRRLYPIANTVHVLPDMTIDCTKNKGYSFNAMIQQPTFKSENAPDLAIEILTKMRELADCDLVFAGNLCDFRSVPMYSRTLHDKNLEKSKGFIQRLDNIHVKCIDVNIMCLVDGVTREENMSAKFIQSLKKFSQERKTWKLTKDAEITVVEKTQKQEEQSESFASDDVNKQANDSPARLRQHPKKAWAEEAHAQDGGGNAQTAPRHALQHGTKRTLDNLIAHLIQRFADFETKITSLMQSLVERTDNISAELATFRPPTNANSGTPFLSPNSQSKLGEELENELFFDTEGSPRKKLCMGHTDAESSFTASTASTASTDSITFSTGAVE